MRRAVWDGHPLVHCFLRLVLQKWSVKNRVELLNKIQQRTFFFLKKILPLFLLFPSCGSKLIEFVLKQSNWDSDKLQLIKLQQGVIIKIINTKLELECTYSVSWYGNILLLPISMRISPGIKSSSVSLSVPLGLCTPPLMLQHKTAKHI